MLDTGENAEGRIGDVAAAGGTILRAGRYAGGRHAGYIVRSNRWSRRGACGIGSRLVGTRLGCGLQQRRIGIVGCFREQTLVDHIGELTCGIPDGVRTHVRVEFVPAGQRPRIVFEHPTCISRQACVVPRIGVWGEYVLGTEFGWELETCNVVSQREGHFAPIGSGLRANRRGGQLVIGGQGVEVAGFLLDHRALESWGNGLLERRCFRQRIWCAGRGCAELYVEGICRKL